MNDSTFRFLINTKELKDIENIQTNISDMNKKFARFLMSISTIYIIIVPVTAETIVGNYYSFQSYNYPDYFIRHQDSLGEITKIISDLDKKDATFKLVPGLADNNYVSFESLNYPGYYLRHQDWRIKLFIWADKELFKNDATFKLVPGLADNNYVSFESLNYPGYFIRHKNYHLYIDKYEDTDLFRNDATFMKIDRVQIISTPLQTTTMPISTNNEWISADMADGLSQIIDDRKAGWYGAFEHITFNQDDVGKILEVETESYGHNLRIELINGFIFGDNHYWWTTNTFEAFSDGTDQNPVTVENPKLRWKIKAGEYTLFFAGNDPNGIVKYILSYKKVILSTGDIKPRYNPTITTPIETEPIKTSEVDTHVSIYGEKTDIIINEDILLRLSAVNLINKPVMVVQVILYPPSGMSVTGQEFVKSGAGIYTTTYKLDPGDSKDIEIKIRPNQIGNFEVKGVIVYYFGDDKSSAETITKILPIKVSKNEEYVKDIQTKNIPGFGIILVMIILLIARCYIGTR